MYTLHVLHVCEYTKICNHKTRFRSQVTCSCFELTVMWLFWTPGTACAHVMTSPLCFQRGGAEEAVRGSWRWRFRLHHVRWSSETRQRGTSPWRSGPCVRSSVIYELTAWSVLVISALVSKLLTRYSRMQAVDVTRRSCCRRVSRMTSPTPSWKSCSISWTRAATAKSASKSSCHSSLARAAHHHRPQAVHNLTINNAQSW